ncbi:hypothetical protein N7526_003216 [Penicillium atrosanguineum]|nr:hypothetical protein N7526_003216 [Penicillium atrosanguineum]
MATTIRTADFVDFHTIGRQAETEQELVGREFLTHYIEDVASPSEDGWYISDFYLFHYLLSPTFPRIAPNQIWLTCEDPETLVAEYHEYLHGDSNEDRRAVLDSQRLPDILKAGNLRVVPRDFLLERYLNTLQEQAAEAARLREHLVLLIFGHGSSTHDVEVAGSILRLRDLRQVLRNRSQVTLFTTSCYSGGWLVLPDIGQQQLNATAITAAGQESLSSSGSLAASAVLRCLVDAEDEINENMDHPTYIQFAKSVYDCMKGMGMLGDTQQIHFSAENDEWETSYQTRLGLPLISYKEKWQSLRQVPPSTCPASGQLARAGGRRLKRLQYLAQEYFASRPGPDNGGLNIGLHNCLNPVLMGASYPQEKVQQLTKITAYRLGAMYEADYLREQIGLQYPSLFDTDPNQELSNLSDNQMSMKTWSLLLTHDINTTPIGIKRPYVKPLRYLTLALVETSQSWEAIERQVKAMAGKKKAWYRFIYKAWQGNRVARDEGMEEPKVEDDRIPILKMEDQNFENHSIPSKQSPTFDTPIVSAVSLPPGYWAHMAKEREYRFGRRAIRTPGTLLYSMRDLPSRREPILRAPNSRKRIWPMNGRDLIELINQKPHNTEALYAQVVADKALEGQAACTNCLAGDGLYPVCVRVSGQYHCANCHHGRQQDRCSLRPATSLGAGENNPEGEGNSPLQGTERASKSIEAGNIDIAEKIGNLLLLEEKELARLHDMVAKKEDLIQTLKAIQESLSVSSRLR